MSRNVRILFLAGGIAYVIVSIVRTGPTLLLEMLRRVGWSVGTVVLLYSAHVVVRALALWRVVVDRSVGFADVLRVRLSGEAVEVLTYTGPFLAEPAKGWLLTRRGLPTAVAFGAIATEYLLYTTVSAALALTAFSLLAVYGLAPVFARASMGIALAMAAFIVAVGFAAVSGIGLIVPAVRASGALLGRSRMSRAADAIEPVERELVAFIHERPARMTEVLAIEAVSHALMIAEIWIVLSALGVPYSARDPLIIEGGAKLIGVAFFFIPGQLGAMEAVYAALLRAVGLSASVGLTLAFVRRLRSVCVATAGLLVLARFHVRP